VAENKQSGALVLTCTHPDQTLTLPVHYPWQAPTCLAQLTQLTCLDLRKADLSHTADILLALTSLQELRLWSCNLESLPPKLARLTRLTNLQ
jgi:Leucine-rich repeat (LRR) protein